MSPPKRGLGRGLSALIPRPPDPREDKQTAPSSFEVAVDRITPSPFQPRRSFDEGKIEELAASIRNQGIIQPLVVRRSVHQFAAVPAPTGDTLPAYAAEVGLAGICLEPTHGYVFVTYAYRDSTGVLRNALVRYRTPAGRFAVRPQATVLFRNPFARDVSAPSHQIGPCQATTNALFVSVGDGEQRTSQQLGSTLGKVLRLGLDGQPLPTNPFYVGGGTAAYVWARGLRNPFGLKLVGDRVWVADNGLAVDRFLEIERGRNYLWDGTDRSIGAAAAQTFFPPLAPVQLDFCTESGLPAAWRNRFYVALAGPPPAAGPDVSSLGKGVMALDYGLAERRMRSVPRYLLRYRGTHHQSVVGLGCGPDGIYFVPIFPDTTGQSAVLVVRYNPDSIHPYPLAGDRPPIAFMEDNGCFGCHSLRGKGGTAGPALDHDSLVPRLRARLESAEYRTRVLAVDSLSGEPFTSYRAARAQVLAASAEARLFIWVRYQLREPKFDNPNSLMPNLGLSEPDVASLAEFLLTPRERPPRMPRVGPPPRAGRVNRAKAAPPVQSRVGSASCRFRGGLSSRSRSPEDC